MKWIALLLFILIGIGATIAIQRDKRAGLAVAFLLGFLPFVMAPWHLLIAPYSMASWPGYVKGLGIRPDRRLRGRLPGRPSQRTVATTIQICFPSLHRFGADVCPGRPKF